MSIETAIARFRDRQAGQFSEDVVVYRQVGELSTNPTTGAVTRTFTEVYDGPCKIRPADRSGNDVRAGETEVRTLDMVGKFPVDTALRKDDVVDVEDSTFDATMVGRRYRVTEAPADGWQIAKVVRLEEIQVPELNLESA